MAADRFYSNGARKHPPSKCSRSVSSRSNPCKQYVTRNATFRPLHPSTKARSDEDVPSANTMPDKAPSMSASHKKRHDDQDDGMAGDISFKTQLAVHTHKLPNGHLTLTLRSTQVRRHRSPSRDPLEEPDGRRIRIALPDPEDVDELRQRRLQAAVARSNGGEETSSLRRRLFMLPGSMNDADIFNDQPMTNTAPQIAISTGVCFEDLPEPIRSNSSLETLRAAQAQLWPFSIYASPTETDRNSQQSVIDADMHEDALAVDHPRRSYDTAAFMEKLLQDERIVLPSFEGSSYFHMAIAPRREEVTRSQVKDDGVDIQGLKWACMSREAAVRLRKDCHPSKNKTETPLVQRAALDVERHYQFRSFYPQHRAHFGHYQLRNVLTASNRNDIFYAAGNKVMQTSLSFPTECRPVMDLSRADNTISNFRVMCLSTPQKDSFSDYQSDNVLLAGGFNGEYAMLDLSSENRCQHIEGIVTHAWSGIVTHIHTYPARRSGVLDAVFCSNDGRVRLMDVKAQRWIGCFGYEHSINCSATAPDGRLRLLAVDANAAYITNAENGDIIARLEGFNDHSFACAWSPDSRLVATGAQDGKVIVYDTRNWNRPLQTLDSVMSCARSLHFTHDSALVAAENEDIVSIYDTKDFNIRQDICFFGSIAGVALLDGGSEIAIANADRTVGGLLSFQRKPHGLDGASYGKELLGRHSRSGNPQWHRHSWTERLKSQRSACVSEVFV